MKIRHYCLLGVVLGSAVSCETSRPGRSPSYSSSRYTAAAPRPAAAPAPVAQATNLPPPPDAALMYQRTGSDAFGSSTYTSNVQVRGPVVEEVHIGNQRVDPYGAVYPPATIDGVVQPGYVPAGTSRVIDPMTGRLLPVRRR